jgi:histidinol phosphatase-like PHP family hydrolase
MDNQIQLDQDWHVSTTFSDGVATVEENVRAAEDRRLKAVCLVDRVSGMSSWVRRFADTCGRADRRNEVEVHSGVEVEVLNTSGTLDLPANFELVDHLFVTVRRLPTPEGPMRLDEARTKIAAGELLPATVVEWLVRASSNAAKREGSVVVAHPFGILSDLGLDERNIHRPFVRCLAGSLAESGSAITLSERWRSPSAWVAACFVAAGVTVHPSTDSQSPSTLGRYVWCRRVADELSRRSCGNLPLVQAA